MYNLFGKLMSIKKQNTMGLPIGNLMANSPPLNELCNKYLIAHPPQDILPKAEPLTKPLTDRTLTNASHIITRHRFQDAKTHQQQIRKLQIDFEQYKLQRINHQIFEHELKYLGRLLGNQEMKVEDIIAHIKTIIQKQQLKTNSNLNHQEFIKRFIDLSNQQFIQKLAMTSKSEFIEILAILSLSFNRNEPSSLKMKQIQSQFYRIFQEINISSDFSQPQQKSPIKVMIDPNKAQIVQSHHLIQKPHLYHNKPQRTTKQPNLINNQHDRYSQNEFITQQQNNRLIHQNQQLRSNVNILQQQLSLKKQFHRNEEQRQHAIDLHAYQSQLSTYNQQCELNINSPSQQLKHLFGQSNNLTTQTQSLKVKLQQLQQDNRNLYKQISVYRGQLQQKQGHYYTQKQLQTVLALKYEAMQKQMSYLRQIQSKYNQYFSQNGRNSIEMDHQQIEINSELSQQMQISPLSSKSRQMYLESKVKELEEYKRQREQQIEVLMQKVQRMESSEIMQRELEKWQLMIEEQQEKYRQLKQTKSRSMKKQIVNEGHENEITELKDKIFKLQGIIYSLQTTERHVSVQQRQKQRKMKEQDKLKADQLNKQKSSSLNQSIEKLSVSHTSKQNDFQQSQITINNQNKEVKQLETYVVESIKQDEKGQEKENKQFYQLKVVSLSSQEKLKEPKNEMLDIKKLEQIHKTSEIEVQIQQSSITNPITQFSVMNDKVTQKYDRKGNGVAEKQEQNRQDQITKLYTTIQGLQSQNTILQQQFNKSKQYNSQLESQLQVTRNRQVMINDNSMSQSGDKNPQQYINQTEREQMHSHVNNLNPDRSYSKIKDNNQNGRMDLNVIEELDSRNQLDSELKDRDQITPMRYHHQTESIHLLSQIKETDGYNYTIKQSITNKVAVDNIATQKQLNISISMSPQSDTPFKETGIQHIKDQKVYHDQNQRDGNRKYIESSNQSQETQRNISSSLSKLIENRPYRDFTLFQTESNSNDDTQMLQSWKAKDKIKQSKSDIEKSEDCRKLMIDSHIGTVSDQANNQNPQMNVQVLMKTSQKFKELSISSNKQQNSGENMFEQSDQDENQIQKQQNSVYAPIKSVDSSTSNLSQQAKGSKNQCINMNCDKKYPLPGKVAQVQIIKINRKQPSYQSTTISSAIQSKEIQSQTQKINQLISQSNNVLANKKDILQHQYQCMKQTNSQSKQPVDHSSSSSKSSYQSPQQQTRLVSLRNKPTIYFNQVDSHSSTRLKSAYFGTVSHRVESPSSKSYKYSNQPLNAAKSIDKHEYCNSHTEKWKQQNALFSFSLQSKQIEELSESNQSGIAVTQKNDNFLQCSDC